MADRTVNGNQFTENGWRLVDTGSCVWVAVPGTNPPVKLQIREGQPAKIMGAFAADFNAYVEPLRDADSACYTESNSVLGTPGRNNGSNHMSATGMDLNWNGPDGRTFRYGISKERAYPGAKSKALDDLIDFYEGMIFCGGNWSNHDWMHMQMGGSTYGSQNFAKVESFISRKIRPDGFSTYKRGGTVTPPVVVAPPAASPPAATILARATGITQAKAEQILAQVQFALTKANCTTPRRIAAALAQWVIESGHFIYTEEIADGPETQERWKYKGRTWVQLTWLENYLGFSKWCYGLGLVPSPTYFGDRPHELAEQKWAALGPAYWWAVKYPRINEYADRGDIDNVSKWVNAPAWVDNPNRHANGEAERRAAYEKALSLGDQLLVLTITGATDSGEDMAAVPQDQWDRVYRELTQRLPSRSPLRHVGEGVVDTLAGFVLNIDGSQHVEIVTRLARYGDPDALSLLREVANNTEPDRQHDAQLAQAILADVTAPASSGTQPASVPLQAVTQALPAPVDNSAELAAAYAENARLRDENSRLKSVQVVYRDEPAAVEVAAKSQGQTIGQFIDAVAELNLSDASSIQERATLGAAIKVLSTKNGTDL